jgi:proteasome accessory factor B
VASTGLSNPDEVDYAQALVRCYVNRGGSTVTEASPLIRQWILLRTLCARHHGVTVQELAAEMEVVERTIRRDLEAFQTAGFPLIETVGQFGRKSYRIDPKKNQPGMSFAYDEAIALYLGRRFLEPLAGTIFWEAAQRAFKKIRSTLGKEALKYVDQFAAVFHQTAVGASDYSQKADLIDTLMQGIEDRRATFITYQSLHATEAVTYDVYPLGVTYHRGSLYLVGLKVDAQQLRSPDQPSVGAGRGQGEGRCVAGEGDRSDESAIRHWKVDRIEGAELTEIRFSRPDGFDLPSHFAKSFGVFQGDGEVHVKVRFAPSVARYVQESAWHASQKLTKEKDGGLLAEFDLDGTEEIMRWILSFGRHAEVVEPEELRQEILDEACAIAELVQSKVDADHD